MFLNTEKLSVEVSLNPYPTLTAGDELSLTCRVKYTATVRFKWYRNKGPVSPKAEIYTELNERSSILFIAEVLVDDSGKYSCEAHTTMFYQTTHISNYVTVNINAKGKVISVV